MKIADILKQKRSQKVITIDHGETIAEAVKRLNAYELGALLVVDGEGKVVGIFTERDLLRALNDASWEAIAATVVSDLMTGHVECVASDTEAMVALKHMERRQCRHTPVLDPEARTVVGMISMRDLRSAAVDVLQFEHDAMWEVLTATGVSVRVPQK